MGYIYSEMPLPAYLIFVFGLAILCIINAIIRRKKDRKSLIAVCYVASIFSFLAGIYKILDTCFPFTNFLKIIVLVLIGVSMIAIISILSYAAWTNEKNPNAKKIVVVALLVLLIDITVGFILFKFVFK